MGRRQTQPAARYLDGNGHPHGRSGTIEDLERFRAGRTIALTGPDHGSPAAAVTGYGARGRYRRIAAGLAMSDALCVVVALASSYYLRYPAAQLMPLRETIVIVLGPLLWLGVFHTFDLYAPQHLSAPEELRRVIGASGVGIVLLVMTSFWSMASFSRAWVGLTWVLVLIFELAVRRYWRAWEWRLRLDGRLALRTLIVGTSPEAGRLVEILRAPGSGFLPLGYAQTSDTAAKASANSLPVLGAIDELDRLVREQAADCLFVASTGITLEEMAQVSQTARQEGTELRVLPNLPQTLTSRLSLLKVGPAIALALKPVRLSGRQAAIKRAFDLVAAAAPSRSVFPCGR